MAAETLTIPEAAARLGISPRAYHRAWRRQEVPGFRCGARILVSTIALDRLLDTGTWKPAP